MSVKLNENRLRPSQPAPKKVLDGGNPNVNPSLGTVGYAAQVATKKMPLGRTDDCDDITPGENGSDDCDNDGTERGKKKKTVVS